MPSADRTDRALPDSLGAWILFATGLLTFAHVAGPVTTNDLFWHIKSGEHLWSATAWPREDVFSYTTSGLEWIVHEWLTQVVFYGLYELGGFPALRLLTGCAAVGILWLVYRFAHHHLGSRALAAAIVTCFAILGASRFQTRPTLFSMVAILGYLLWLSRRRGPFLWRHVLAFAALEVVWVNLHSVGLLGVVILGTWFLGRAGQRILRYGQYPDRGELGRIAAAVTSSFLASLASPQGLHLYAFAFQDKAKVMNFVIDEWGAFHLLYSHNTELGVLPYLAILTALALLIGITLLTGAAIQMQPERCRQLMPDPVELGFLVLFVTGGLMARRFHWFLAIGLVLALVQLRRLHRAGAIPFCRGWLEHSRPAAVGVAALLLGCLVGVEYRYADRSLAANLIEPDYYTRDIAPALDLDGIRFLQEAGLEGNAFSHYGSGGMMSFALHPRVRVFIDSRADLYRRQVLLDFLTIRDGHPAQQALLDRYGTDIYYRHWEIAPLREPGLWSKVFAGRDGEVYLRRKKGNLENLARAKRWHAGRAQPPR